MALHDKTSSRILKKNRAISELNPWRKLLAAAVLTVALAPACQAEAQDAGVEAAKASPHEGSLFERDVMLGDFGGWRSHLEDSGLSLGATSIDETMSVVSGGVSTGSVYAGRLEMTATLDFEKAFNWPGASFHANAYQIRGRGLGSNYLGNNILIPSNIEATRTTRLYDLWLQQEMLDGTVSLRLGQIAADEEFIISQYATAFVNPTFGWPQFAAFDMPSGGPGYPFAMPGARLKFAPGNDLTFLLAVLNGDPAGAGAGDPQARDGSGTSFRLNDGALVMGEAAASFGQLTDENSLPGTYKLGFWYDSTNFADLRFDRNGLPLADPAAQAPAQRQGDFGLWAVIDQMVWREPGTPDGGLGVFLRISGSPADRSILSFYFDAGATYKGPFAGRENDVLGLAFGYAKISSALSGLDGDFARISGTPSPIRDFESVLELTYRAQMTPWLALQPDFQYIFRPSGVAANPADPTGTHPIPDAAVLGIRSTIAF